jgi:DNA-binding GntR family transcriptional regulator
MLAMKSKIAAAPEASGAEPSMAESAFLTLEEWIGMRRLPAGSMVSEAQLAQELGMGRTPVREALQRLHQLGFVEMHPRRGTMVSSADVRQQLEMLEVRRPLEDLMVQAAATRASDAERTELRRLAAQLRAAAEKGQHAAFYHLNRDIHICEAAATHNASLIKIMQAVHAQSRRFWYQHMQRKEVFVEAARLHSAVLNAIVQKEGAEATQKARDLMNFLEGLTRSALDNMLP